MQLKPGLKLKAPGTSTEIIVIQAPVRDVTVTCGGVPMSPDGSGEAGDVAGEVVIGKRYSDVAGTVELLCSAGGAGPLALDGEELAVKAAKALPSSD
ncbi:hypothetical protein [Nocardioides ochotonae]|uniref:hypothetical protein n=1 Tax=Nocardioides ochotonae TaxID=2685869 RepID=UPI001408A736|nr:hypothetical protein [Nocardioides ochotonae]